MSIAPPGKVIKEYPGRGPLHQYRLEKISTFSCFRCGQQKTSKLLTTYQENWARLLCNGCYGRLLSIYEVKAGTAPEDVKAQALADLLLTLVPNNAPTKPQNEMMRSYRELLSAEASKFVATSEHVAHCLRQVSGLDWSAAIIGLCKAVELEFVRRVVDPIKRSVAGKDLAADSADKDVGRVTKYIESKGPPPELGSIRHFLSTAANSKTRAATSVVLQALTALVDETGERAWLLANDGAIQGLEVLTTRYRNRAAHVDELAESDYQSCFELVCGTDGILSSLCRSS